MPAAPADVVKALLFDQLVTIKIIIGRLKADFFIYRKK